MNDCPGVTLLASLVQQIKGQWIFIASRNSRFMGIDRKWRKRLVNLETWIDNVNQSLLSNSAFIMWDCNQARSCFLYIAIFLLFACLFTSVTLHPSIFLRLSHRPSRAPVSHQSCAASRLILPSPIIEGLNYRACQPPSGEPFVMWTGLDRTERGCLGFSVGTHISVCPQYLSVCLETFIICTGLELFSEEKLS